MISNCLTLHLSTKTKNPNQKHSMLSVTGKRLINFAPVDQLGIGGGFPSRIFVGVYFDLSQEIEKNADNEDFLKA